MAQDNRDSTIVSTKSDYSNENDNFVTVKTTLDSIVRHKFREKVKEHIPDLAIKATQITALLVRY